MDDNSYAKYFNDAGDDDEYTGEYTDEYADETIVDKPVASLFNEEPTDERIDEPTDEPTDERIVDPIGDEFFLHDDTQIKGGLPEDPALEIPEKAGPGPSYKEALTNKTSIETDPAVTAEEKLKEQFFLNVSECNFAKSGEVCSPDDVIKIMHKYLSNNGTKISGKEKKIILDQMKTKTKCQTEACVLQNPDFGKELKSAAIDPEKILEENFKTIGPANSTEWLDNFQIDTVLDQLLDKFQKIYGSEKEFLHIPFQMRDFEAKGAALSQIIY
jgi:hypothetical protein